MSGILIAILSVCGRIFLIFMLLLLVSLLLLLFFPICYRVRGIINEDERAFEFSLKWLFGVFRMNACYPSAEKKFSMHFLWKDLLKKKCNSKGNRKKQKKDVKKDQENKNEMENENSDLQNDITDRNNLTANLENDTQKDAPNEQALKDEQELSNQWNEQKDMAQNGNKGIDPSRGENEENTDFDNGNNRIRNLLYTLRSYCDKIKAVLNSIKEKKLKLDRLVELLQSPAMAELISVSKLRLLKLGRLLLPRKLFGEFMFGTGQPDSTGYILGIYAVFSPYIKGSFDVTPNFEEKCLKGSIRGKGHFNLFLVSVHILRILLDRNFRKVMKDFKQWKSQ